MIDNDLPKVSFQGVHKRQQFYFAGQDCEAAGDIEGAIEAYKEYAQWLDIADQHMPHLWIFKLYNELDQPVKALAHKELYAKGCSTLFSATKYKETGAAYEELELFDKALACYEIAITRNPNIGLKTKIKELKNSGL